MSKTTQQPKIEMVITDLKMMIDFSKYLISNGYIVAIDNNKLVATYTPQYYEIAGVRESPMITDC